MGVKNLCIFVFWIKVASALERLRVLEIANWVYDTFDNNSGIKNYFTKY